MQDVVNLWEHNHGFSVFDDQRRSPRRLLELVGEVDRYDLEQVEDPIIAVARHPPKLELGRFIQ